MEMLNMRVGNMGFVNQTVLNMEMLNMRVGNMGFVNQTGIYQSSIYGSRNNINNTYGNGALSKFK